tara:strand:+ start:647 stop:790 length:144 start_codon:yes stop_codon:yes gene_type:complete
MIKEYICPDCKSYLHQDQMSSDLICINCETCFEKNFDEQEKKESENQ